MFTPGARCASDSYRSEPGANSPAILACEALAIQGRAAPLVSEVSANGACFDFHRNFILGIRRVEMGHSVLAVEHTNHDPEEPRNFRHADDDDAIVKSRCARRQKVQRARAKPYRWSRRNETPSRSLLSACALPCASSELGNGSSYQCRYRRPAACRFQS